MSLSFFSIFSFLSPPSSILDLKLLFMKLLLKIIPRVILQTIFDVWGLKKQKFPVANYKFWISPILGLETAFTAFEYPIMAISSKISPSGTKKSKINIKNHFCKCLAFKGKKKYMLAFWAFVEVKMWFLDHFWIIATYFEQNSWSNNFWMKFPKTSHCVITGP